MTDRVQVWLDKLELTELLAVLSAAVDRGDRAAIIDCYADGVVRRPWRFQRIGS